MSADEFKYLRDLSVEELKTVAEGTGWGCTALDGGCTGYGCAK